MQLIKAILSLLGAVLAMFMGLMTVAVIAVVAAAYFVVQRLRGHGRPARPPGEAGPSRRPVPGDVIDVTATEVRNEPPAR